VSTSLTGGDRLDAWRVRWGIGRMHCRVEPGLYAAGQPTAESPVLVTANYKISFDRLRSQLTGQAAWVLVLDTVGINVWCAAAKGTFGTDELVRRIETTGLPEVVSHRTLVVPQLGAVGVAAHEVRKRSGFRVVYGPVRAADLPAFLAAGMKATPEMREVRFPLLDRLAVTPIELVYWPKYLVWVMLAMALLAGLGPDGYSWGRTASVGLPSSLLLFAAWAASLVLTAALLPWLPGRAFAAKGAWLGVALLPATSAFGWLLTGCWTNWVAAAAWCLMIPVVASFMAMNFTGSTPFTSLSGVRREMRVAIPLQVVGAAIAAVLWVVGLFV
jgi:acetyl-CoA decarbonylase/synthase complex subunit gamma